MVRRTDFRNNPEGYLEKHAERHAHAEAVDRDIRSMAFPNVGDEPGQWETMAGEDIEAMAFSMVNLSNPSHLLNREQVLRKWEVPELPPSHHEGFGSSVATNLEAGNISAKPDVPHLQGMTAKISERMGGHHDPLGQIVANRRASIQESLASGNPDANWYQGKAQALIHHTAMEAEVPIPVARKTTATASPKMPWDVTYAENPTNKKLGRIGETVFPNVAVAGQIIESAKGRTPDEAAEHVVERGIAGIQRQPAARVASSMLRGELHGSDLIPQEGASEKVQSFDVNLSDPTHPKWGYSPWVHRHQLSAHTPDVQDARAGGFHEDMLEVPRPTKVNKEGKTVPVGNPFHEVMLGTPAGTDVAQSTALIARTEEFEDQRSRHGDEWARQNAKNFMAGPSQSMQWSVARKTGSVEIPEHIEKAYQNRPAPTGFDRATGTGTKMTKRDYEQM